MTDYPHDPLQWERLKDNGELHRYYVKYRCYKQARRQDTTTANHIKKYEERIRRMHEADNTGVDTEEYR